MAIQTLVSASGMFRFGSKRTFRSVIAVSTLPRERTLCFSKTAQKMRPGRGAFANFECSRLRSARMVDLC
jgi:hypothetical protein